MNAMKSLRPLLVATLVLATASLAEARTKTPDPSIPATPPGSSAILLGVDTVQNELKLTSLQRAVLNDIRSEYRDDARKITAKVAAGQQTKKRGYANIKDLTASSDRRALRVLNDSQRDRLEEIHHQILGGYVLLSPALQTKLGLTEVQKSKIAKIWVRGEKYTSKVNKWFEQGRISFYERLLYLRENRLDRSDDFLAVLTEDQLAKLEQISGKKFPG